MRGILFPAIAAGFALAGCSDNSIAEEPEPQKRAEAIAAQTPAPEQFDFQTMSVEDLGRNDLLGASCAFFEADAEQPLAVATKDAGAVKYEDSVRRLASDAGSAKAPLDTYTKYDGMTLSFRLTFEGEGQRSGEETTEYPARLVISDSYDRVTYDRAGTARCVA